MHFQRDGKDVDGPRETQLNICSDVGLNFFYSNISIYGHCLECNKLFYSFKQVKGMLKHKLNVSYIATVTAKACSK